jgi:hypothetical protein
MSEKRLEVKTYLVKKICDKCNEGEMKRDEVNIMLATYPPQYVHKCTKCGCKENYFESYPKIEYDYVK